MFEFLFVSGSYNVVAEKIVVIFAAVILLFGALCFLIDVISNRNSKSVFNFLVVFVPITAFLIAGKMLLYPFANRLVISLLPLFFIIIAKGFDYKNNRVIKILLKILFFTLIISYCHFSNFSGRMESFHKYQNTKFQNGQREIYKKIANEMDRNRFIYIEVDEFLTSFIYNYMYKFSNNVYSYYYNYKNLSVYPGKKNVINAINKEENIYYLGREENYIREDMDVWDIRNFVFDNYDCSVEEETHEGIILYKCTKK